MALGRKRDRSQVTAEAAAGPGLEACGMCGETVPVGPDGRCDLGHRVRQPQDAYDQADLGHTGLDQTEPISHVDVPAAPVAGLAAEGLALGHADDAPNVADAGEPMRDEDPGAGGLEDGRPGEGGLDEGGLDEDDPAEDDPDGDEPGVDFSSELDW